MALIPAFHVNGNHQCTASLQVISDKGTWWVDYPAEDFSASEKHLYIRIGSNTFSAEGIELKLQKTGISLKGKLDFGLLTPLKSDIMGPFRLLPQMECAHGIISMSHTLQGKLHLNGELLDFTDGRGYIETDRGKSFPSAYFWAQGSLPDGNVMLSVATIPFAGIHFTGCICALLHRGKEYRLATYRGVRVEQWSEDGAVIRQGKYRLSVEVLQKQPQTLHAPKDGFMDRKIQESLRATLRYCFWYGETLVFDHTDPTGSFEYSVS